MPLSPAAQHISEVLRQQGYTGDVLELETSTRSAADAARVVGCDVGRIVKSLVFRGTVSGQPILVLTSGANRVDEVGLGHRLGEPITRADADYVRQQTGFAIGGVPPLGHANPLRTIIDRDLMGHTTIWAAAGTPRALFEIGPDDLVRMTSAEVLAVAESRTEA